MPEQLKHQTGNQPTNWEQSMNGVPPFEQRTSNNVNKEIEKLTKEITKNEQNIVDLKNGVKDDYRPKQKEESIDEYSEYLLSYLRGEAMIEAAQKKSETKTECAKRLIELYESELTRLDAEKDLITNVDTNAVSTNPHAA